MRQVMAIFPGFPAMSLWFYCRRVYHEFFLNNFYSETEVIAEMILLKNINASA
jgi:hypothetical protein